jgi:GxxExxY protein
MAGGTDLTGRVIGLAIEVHRGLGPGMLESVYEECFCLELAEHQIPYARQVHLPVRYKAKAIDDAFRIDVLVAETLVVEIKAVEALLPVHTAQVLTYMRFGRFPMGLLLNFHSVRLIDGLKRLVL